MAGLTASRGRSVYSIRGIGQVILEFEENRFDVYGIDMTAAADPWGQGLERRLYGRLGRLTPDLRLPESRYGQALG